MNTFTMPHFRLCLATMGIALSLGPATLSAQEAFPVQLEALRERTFTVEDPSYKHEAQASETN